LGVFATTGNIIAQSSDPGAIGAGSIWSDTDANIIYRRNDADTAWVRIGLLSGASDTLPILNGGTAQATIQASLNALMAASGTLVQGDTMIIDSSLDVVRLARGTDNQVYAMNVSEPNWQAESVLSLSDQEDILTADDTTTSTTYDTTPLSIVIANRTDGKALCIAVCIVSNDGTNITRCNLFDDASALTGDTQFFHSAGTRKTQVSPMSIVSLNGSTIDLRFKASTGTSVLEFNADEGESKLIILEIS